MRVLPQIGLHNFGNRVTDGFDLSEHLQDAVPNLLHGVGYSVRPMHLDRTGSLVHRELVPLQVKLLVCQGQVLNDRVLALGPDVVIARVIPAADVQSGMCWPGWKGESVFGPIHAPSKCCVFGGAWRASSRCEMPFHMREPAPTETWSISTARK